MNAEDAIRLLGHGWRTFTRPEAELVTGVIREQAARIAELEDDNYYQEESLRMIYLVSTGEDMSPGQTGAVAGKAIERMQRDKARIAELEEKLRWRDCKTEPPTESGWYLMRWNYEEESHGHRIAHFLADKDRTNPNNKPCAWLVGTNRQPDQWRPIE